MARIARVVVPGCPHHVTQRGNRRAQTFFSIDDYQHYIELLSTSCREAGTAVWAYCLMPNHVHLVLVPADADGLRRAIAEPHRKYARRINKRNDWRGHMWQERFYSAPMDDTHLYHAVRYVEQNPVAASLCTTPADWRWSSARAHLAAADDDLVTVAPVLQRVSDYPAYINQPSSIEAVNELELHLRTGRPLGSDEFLDDIEALFGRAVRSKR